MSFDAAEPTHFRLTTTNRIKRGSWVLDAVRCREERGSGFGKRASQSHLVRCRRRARRRSPPYEQSLSRPSRRWMEIGDRRLEISRRMHGWSERGREMEGGMGHVWARGRPSLPLLFCAMNALALLLAPLDLENKTKTQHHVQYLRSDILQRPAHNCSCFLIPASSLPGPRIQSRLLLLTTIVLVFLCCHLITLVALSGSVGYF